MSQFSGVGSVPLSSRVAGRGALLRSLRMLLRRVERFAAHRARCPEDRDWAAKLADRLDAALTDAAAAPGARASLVIAERRAEVNRKGFRRPTHPLERGREVAHG